MRYFIQLDDNSVVIRKSFSPDDQPGFEEVDGNIYEAAKLSGSKLVDNALANYTPPAVAPYGMAPAYMTGRDLIDGMSPAQAKAADTEDPRNLARISAAKTTAEVKSCIARVAKANGITADTLLAQATPTGA